MGDSYRPGGGGGDGRGRYQAQDYERNYRPQQYDPYPPPQRHYDSRPPPGGSSYRPPGPPPSSFHGNSRDSDRGGFTFRGAAGGQSYRPEQNFTFDAPGPRAPNGFAPDNAPRERPRRFDRDNGRPRHAGRGSGAPRGRGRGGFGPKPAHDRAILSKMAGSRETTPEQFEGMNDGQSHLRTSQILARETTRTTMVLASVQKSKPAMHLPLRSGQIPTRTLCFHRQNRLARRRRILCRPSVRPRTNNSQRLIKLRTTPTSSPSISTTTTMPNRTRLHLPSPNRQRKVESRVSATAILSTARPPQAISHRVMVHHPRPSRLSTSGRKHPCPFRATPTTLG